MDKKSESEKKKIIKVFEDAKQEFEEGEENEGWDWYSYGMRNEDLKDAIHEVMGNTLMLELDASSEMYGAQIVGDAVDTVLGGMKKEDIQSFLNSTVGNSDAETTNDVVKFVIESNKKGETNYDGVIIKNVLDYGGDVDERKPHNVYVTFSSNQFKSIYNLNPTDNEDIKYQKTEYEYDENGNPTNIKFGDNSEWNPKIFGDNNRQEQIEEDVEKEKNNAFYPAWIRYNNQNYEDDKLTFAEFMNAIAKWGEQKQEEYDQQMRDISDSQADPYLLELQLRAVKLVEEEQNVGKKFGKNVSKEVRDKQQAEVEKKREALAQDIYEYMYPGLKFEDATYEDKNNAWNQEAEWECYEEKI